MSNWQTDLTTGIQDYVRKFEDAKEHVPKLPRVQKEYDAALQKLREAKEAVSAFVGVYDEESRK